MLCYVSCKLFQLFHTFLKLIHVSQKHTSNFICTSQIPSSVVIAQKPLRIAYWYSELHIFFVTSGVFKYMYSNFSMENISHHYQYFTCKMWTTWVAPGKLQTAMNGSQYFTIKWCRCIVIHIYNATTHQFL